MKDEVRGPIPRNGSEEGKYVNMLKCKILWQRQRKIWLNSNAMSAKK